MGLIDINVEKPSLKRTEIVDAGEPADSDVETSVDEETEPDADEESDPAGDESAAVDVEPASVDDSGRGLRGRLKRVGAAGTALVVTAAGVLTLRKLRARRRDGGEQ